MLTAADALKGAQHISTRRGMIGQRCAADIARHFVETAKLDWPHFARPSQLAPDGDWFCWLILAGRGFGKTRTGAEWVRSQVCGSTPLSAGRYRHIALVAETVADARDVMVGGGKGPGEGSGLLQVHSKIFDRSMKVRGGD
jgi:phage terminase large subunit-like protein